LLPETIGCHTLRATGITAYLENGGTSDQITLDEVERIVI
jgi:hypothetical protein